MLDLGKSLLVLAAAAIFASTASAQWGDLKIKFKLTQPMTKGSAAVPRQHRDCADVPDFDPKAVGPNLEVPHVMVWLNVADASKVRIHPALAQKTASEKPTLKMEGCQFLPHCFFATAGQTFVVKNGEAFNHAPKLFLPANAAINPIIPRGGTVEKEVKKVEKWPASIACNIHPFMYAHVMVAPTPYHGVSDSEGVVTIKDLPVGKWEFKFWHELHRYGITKVERKGKTETWTKGVTSIAIVEGENDLGEIQIVPKK